MEAIPQCSFCDKSQREVHLLIAGPVRLLGFDRETALLGSTTFICDECVDVCLDMIAVPRASPSGAQPQRSAAEEACEAEVPAPALAPKTKLTPKKKSLTP